MQPVGNLNRTELGNAGRGNRGSGPVWRWRNYVRCSLTRTKGIMVRFCVEGQKGRSTVEVVQVIRNRYRELRCSFPPEEGQEEAGRSVGGKRGKGRQNTVTTGQRQ